MKRLAKFVLVVAFALISANVSRAEMLYITACDLSVKAEPNESSTTIGIVNQNDLINVTYVGNGWYRQDNNGYLRGAFLNSHPACDICQADETVSDTSAVDIVRKSVSKVPSRIIDTIANDGWHIVVSNRDIASEYFAGVYGSYSQYVIGVTDSTNKLVIVKPGEQSASAVLHELGHVMDYELGCESDTKELKSLYALEWPKLHAHFINLTSNSKEYFADAFYFYIDNNDELRQISPYTARFLDNAFCVSCEGSPWYGNNPTWSDIAVKCRR